MTSPAAAPSVEPRVRRFGRLNLEVRQSIPRWQHALYVILSIVAGIAISAAILLVAGVNLGGMYEEFILLTFFDRLGLSSVLIESSPLILVGLSAAMAFRVNYWNIGIEGQFFWGAIGATFISIYDIGPPGLRLYIMFALACAGGFGWALVPAFLKVRLNVNEVISTLLFSYIAFQVVLNQVYGPWQDPHERFPHSIKFDPVEQLPKIGWEKVHLGLFVGVALVAVMWWLVERSRFGAYARLVGSNARMALAAGVPVALIVFLSAGLSGALSGAAGFVMAAGQEFRLTATMAAGYAFSGIVIAFLARNHPLGVLVVAILIGGLYTAGQSIKGFYGVPEALVQLLQAVIVLCVAASQFFVSYRLRLARE
ncbi:MAG: ABC transporter permease [Alphaproteobacteria bacterium]|nr:ABC transporter permease [Alphaproteobacteria bacterium]